MQLGEAPKSVGEMHPGAMCIAVGMNRSTLTHIAWVVGRPFLGAEFAAEQLVGAVAITS